MITEFTPSQLHAKAVHERLMGKPVRRFVFPANELRRPVRIAPIPVPEPEPVPFDPMPSGPSDALVKPELGRWKKIAREVEVKHNVTFAVLAGSGRIARFVTARHELWYRMSNETGLSAAHIGRLTGGFDHTTVLSGMRRHQSRMEALAQERT